MAIIVQLVDTDREEVTPWILPTNEIEDLLIRAFGPTTDIPAELRGLSPNFEFGWPMWVADDGEGVLPQDWAEQIASYCGRSLVGEGGTITVIDKPILLGEFGETDFTRGRRI